MPLADIHASYRRLAILRFLCASPAYSSNNQILKTTLNEMGYMASNKSLHEDICFLTEKHLISLEKLDSEEPIGLEVYTLTSEGEDVARGISIVEGVKRPSAGDNLPELP